jgi:methylenetetrahydrofolate dehydrogenase (NADP+)/methenyltetrahydrofolate cyclohydrolase
MKAAEEVGIEVEHRCFTKDVEKDDVLNVIQYYNNEHLVDGIMVQLPLPKGWDERTIIDAISPSKDVDGLTTTNIGRLRSGQKCLKPCTAAGIIDMCKYYDIALDGKDVTIVGRSNIVGKPLADMMMAEGATVTQCHSHTKNLFKHTRPADILISAVGKPNFIDDKTVNACGFVIDVGINRNDEGKLCGDVATDKVIRMVQGITPVPGGVGPMTVAELMKNVVEVWRKRT